MATAVIHDNTTASDILRPIEGNAIWSDGPVTYNIVQLNNNDELESFNSQLPVNTTMTQDMADYWTTEIALALELIGSYIPLELAMSDALDATYLVGQERNDESLGAANTPDNPQDGFRPVMMFNLLSAEHTTDGETGGGSDRFQTIVHELLHTLGINHPHDDGGGSILAPGAQTDGLGFTAPYQWHHTIISYTAAPGAPESGDEGAFTYGRAVTPMALDIAALHRMYGANMTTHTGDTVYQLTDAQSAALDLDGSDGSISIGRAYYGIWDAGSSDTDRIEYNGASSVLINLMPATLTNTPGAEVTDLISEIQNSNILDELPAATVTELTSSTASAGGFFSSVLDDTGMRVPGGYSIANGVVIENASGGSGADLLIGNSAANRLLGNDGEDALFGGLGGDTLSGGEGDDFLFGGNSESDLRDVIYGGNGNDNLDGGYGNDQLRGDAGNDTIVGGYGVDEIFGGLGDDQLTGQAWSDLIFGGDGMDFINGGFGHDRVNGGAGADRFFHIGNLGHGSDWIQDYNAAEGDVLMFGASASRDQFQVNLTETADAGTAGVEEAFVIYRPTGQILWALVDGGGEAQINLLLNGTTIDLLG